MRFGVTIAPRMPAPTSSAWRFDRVVVDPATYRVEVDGIPQPVEPKSFWLLQFLIENRDRVVSKEESFRAVWTDTFVSDNALTRAVAQVRKAIGDDPKQPRYIETLPTVGYRFVAAVTESASAPPAVSSPEPVVENAGRRVPVIVLKGAAVVASLAAIGIVAWLWTHRPGRSEARTAASLLPVQFSSSAGLDMGASFSPDGTLVAYASDKPGSFEIFVKSFDSSARELQLTSDGGQNLAPSFSPDGRWIAFASARRRGIFRVPAIGGTVQRLTNFGVQPVWTPDGRTIVF